MRAEHDQECQRRNGLHRNDRAIAPFDPCHHRGEDRDRESHEGRDHEDAVEYIREHGGRLYVWADLTRCAGPRCTFFTSSLERPTDTHGFRLFGGGDFELFFSDEGLEPPTELRLELAGRRKKRISVHEGYFWV